MQANSQVEMFNEYKILAITRMTTTIQVLIRTFLQTIHRDLVKSSPSSGRENFLSGHLISPFPSF